MMWVLGSALSVASLAVGVRNAWRSSLDFQWSPAKVFWSGVDPYAYYRGPDPSEIILSQAPNYGHLLYVGLWPYSVLPWPMAKIAWAATNLTLLAGALLLMTRALDEGPARRWFWLASILLCIGFAARNVIANGQQTFVVLAGLAALFAYRRRELVGGIALAIVLTKYSVGLQIAAMMLVTGHYRVFLVAGIVTLGAMGVFSWRTGATGLDMLLGPLSVAQVSVAVGFGDLMSLGGRLGSTGPLANTAIVLVSLAVNAMCLALAKALILRAARVDERVVGLLMAATVYLSLGTVFHLKYDYALVIFCLFAVIHARVLDRWHLPAFIAFNFLAFWVLPRHDALFQTNRGGLVMVGLMIGSFIGLALYCLTLAMRRQRCAEALETVRAGQGPI